MSIREPYEVEDVVIGLGDAVADLLDAKDCPKLIGETIQETMTRFSLMYRTLYDLSEGRGDWDGSINRAIETLEAVNKL